MRNEEVKTQNNCKWKRKVLIWKIAAESRADFLHKMRMVLKEIKETRINLKIIKRKPVIVHKKVDIAFNEANELMAIFIKSIETAITNAGGKKI